MVVVEGVIPPAAVFLLQLQNQMGQLLLVFRPIFLRELVDASSRRRNARSSKSNPPPRTTIHAAPDACDPTPSQSFAGVKPGLSQFSITLSVTFLSPHIRKRGVAGLRSSQASAGSIDRVHRPSLQVFAVKGKRSPSCAAEWWRRSPRLTIFSGILNPCCFAS